LAGALNMFSPTMSEKVLIVAATMTAFVHTLERTQRALHFEPARQSNNTHRSCSFLIRIVSYRLKRSCIARRQDNSTGQLGAPSFVTLLDVLRPDTSLESDMPNEPIVRNYVRHLT
jgi:hypothetical protein